MSKKFEELTDIEKKRALRTHIGHVRERIQELEMDIIRMEDQLNSGVYSRTDVMNGYRRTEYDYGSRSRSRSRSRSPRRSRWSDRDAQEEKRYKEIQTILLAKTRKHNSAR